jgi:hypothetical protein
MPGDGLQSGGSGQILHLAGFFPAREIRSDFLKADQLGVKPAKDASDTPDVTAAIHADALVNVIGNHRKGIERALWNCDAGVAHVPPHLVELIP